MRATRGDGWLVAGLLGLAGGLTCNSILGPLWTRTVTYPISQTLTWQTVGLDLVSLVMVGPWCVVAALLVHRDHRAGPIVAIPPAGYAAYMFAQYVVGPAYVTYRPVVALHLAIFVLGWAVGVRAWRAIDATDIPPPSPRRIRIAALGLFVLAGFTLFRYVPAIPATIAGESIPAEALQDPAMYWSIVLLVLGVVVPVAMATAAGLVRDVAWARKALFGIAGWFALVPISVSAMSLVMLLHDDPNAAVGDVALLSSAAVVFVGFAVWVFRPLRRGSEGP